MQEIRTAFWEPYVGFLDPMKEPGFTSEESPLGKIKLFNVWSYDDARAVMEEPWATRRVTPPWLPLRLFHLGLNGPATRGRGRKHDNLRATAEAVIRPETFNPLRGKIQRMTARMREEAGPRFDLAKLAYAVPYQVICLVMGVEADDELRSDELQDRFSGWLDPYGGATSAFSLPNQKEIVACIRDYIRSQRRAGLDDSTPLGRLLNSRRLSEHDKIAMVFFLILSATITTSYAICSTYALLRMELSDEVFEQVQRYSRDPNHPYLTRAYNEALRFHGPVKGRPVRIRKPVELAGQRLRPGALVQFWYSSANRDKAVFDRPDQFLPLRPPKDHISFGTGDYACPGRNLSATVAGGLLREILARPEPPRLQGVRISDGAILRMQEMKLG